ncbi:MAG: hypothetical protein ACRCYY_06505 [Trueperaceae bacterium]
MTHPAYPNFSKPIPWLQHVFLILFFLGSLAAFVVWFAHLPRGSSVAVSEAGLELSLTGAIGTNLVLDAEDTAQTLSCEQNTIRFFQAPMAALYGLSWTFTVPARVNLGGVFTLGSTYPLTLSLVSDAGAYRTFTATEGGLSFDSNSKRGYFTAFLYDENGERVFASAAWQCN